MSASRKAASSPPSQNGSTSRRSGAERARRRAASMSMWRSISPARASRAASREARPRASGVSSCMETSPMCRSGMGFSASRGISPRTGMPVYVSMLCRMRAACREEATRLRTTPARLTGSKWASPAMTAAAVRVILVTVRVSRTGAPRARARVAVEQLPCTSRPSYRPRLPSIMARSASPNEVQKSARNRASVKKKGSRLVGVRPEARPSHAASM